MCPSTYFRIDKPINVVSWPSYRDDLPKPEKPIRESQHSRFVKLLGEHGIEVALTPARPSPPTNTRPIENRKSRPYHYAFCTHEIRVTAAVKTQPLDSHPTNTVEENARIHALWSGLGFGVIMVPHFEIVKIGHNVLSVICCR